jgi:hypothetical protein
MEFAVLISSDGRKYRINVKRIYEGDTIERYEISAGCKKVLVRTNINLLKQKKLKAKKVEWKLEHGEIENVEAFVSTLRAIEHHFEQLYDIHPHLQYSTRTGKIN